MPQIAGVATLLWETWRSLLAKHSAAEAEADLTRMPAPGRRRLTPKADEPIAATGCPRVGRLSLLPAAAASLAEGSPAGPIRLQAIRCEFMSSGRLLLRRPY